VSYWLSSWELTFQISGSNNLELIMMLDEEVSLLQAGEA
jgi:hypothetical protein